MKFSIYNNQNGYLGVLTVIIVSVVTLAAATTITLLGISEMVSGDDAGKSGKSFQRAEGCAEEAYYRLKRNSGYTGGTVPFASGTCTISVSGSGSTRTITSTATYEDFTRTITSDVAFTSNVAGNTEGIDLTEWDE